MPVRTLLMKLFVIASILMTMPVMAQERTAGGSLATEASWTALQNMITATNGNVTTLRIDMNEVKKCGALRKIWTGTQCLDSATIDSIVNCGKSGTVFNGTGCVAVATPPAAASLRWTAYGQGSNRGAFPGKEPVQRAGAACTTKNATGRADNAQDCGSDNNPKVCYTLLRCE